MKIRPSCSLNQPALCFPRWKNIVTCYIFLKLRSSNPQEQKVTALPHLRIAQHSSSLPQNGNCTAWIASLQAQEGWRVRLSLQLWRNVTTISVCTQAHRGQTELKHWHCYPGPGRQEKTETFLDLSAHPNQSDIFQAFVCLWGSFLGLVGWLVGCCWGFFILYKWQCFPFWLHRVLPDPRMVQHSHLTNFHLSNLLKGNKKNKTFMFNGTDGFVKLDRASWEVFVDMTENLRGGSSDKNVRKSDTCICPVCPSFHSRQVCHSCEILTWTFCPSLVTWTLSKHPH